MTFTPNEDGINTLFRKIADKLEAADADLRARLTGKPADEIVDEVTASMVAFGANTDSTHMREYAEAISEGIPFSLDRK